MQRIPPLVLKSLVLLVAAISFACGNGIDRRLAKAQADWHAVEQADDGGYASTQREQVADLLVLAQSEVTHQLRSGRLGRRYQRADLLLDRIEVSLAEAWLAVRSGQARTEREALRALAEARLAVGRVAETLEIVPAGVDTAADTQVMRQDLEDLRHALVVAETALERRDLAAARDTARSVVEAARTTANLIRRSVAYLPTAHTVVRMASTG